MLTKDEKRMNSIPKAIGLFMIFKAMFYRDSFDGLTFSQSTLDTYIQYSHEASFYLFVILGIGLCYKTGNFVINLTYAACAMTLFGAIYTLAPQEVNYLRATFEIGAHVILCAVLLWVQKKLNILHKLHKEFLKEQQKDN